MKVVYDNNNKFDLTISQNYLTDYNKKRFQINLLPINDITLIPRHDPILIELISSDTTVYSNNSLCIAEIYSNEYSIIVQDGAEIVIDDPVATVDHLCHDLWEIYYNSTDNMDNIHIQCNALLLRIIAIIDTY